MAKFFRMAPYFSSSLPIRLLTAQDQAGGAAYVDLPKIYAFKDARQKEIMINRNFAWVNRERACSTQRSVAK